jgi:aminoglycoside phosphotransferase (APT) family kinase protein
VAYLAGDRVLRVLRPTNPASIAAGYEREPALLALLGGRGLPVPREARLLRGEDGRPLATLHRYVEGEAAHRSAPGGTPPRGAARARLAAEVGRFLAALHATPVRETRALGVPSLDLGRERYLPLAEECAPALAPRTRAWVEAELARFLDEGGTAHVTRALVHGDIAGWHLLARPDGTLAGVIDWAEAVVADPALDFAGVLWQFPPSFLARVLDAYASAGRRAGAVARDADLERRIRFYLTVVALFQVRYGWMLGGAAGEAQTASGRRRLAAQAAAHTRAAR